MPAYQRSRTHQILAIVLVVAIALLNWWLERQEQIANPAGPRDNVRVERVVDGDTLLLGPDGTRARLQGIDTPETVKEDSPVEPWGPEATQFTRDFVRAAGNRVEIEVDGERQDQYGRRLVFVWAGERLLNEELVRAGLARPKLAYDYSQAKKDRLKQAQREAQAARRGIWSDKNGRADSVSPSKSPANPANRRE
ncbi:MAG: thermonuclease family protein [Pirellulales bacterium]|nr:thermonuclease family protein [Pirellulales bacterium]